MRATSATRAPPCENACASSRPSPRLAPVITTRFPVTSATTGEGRGDVDLLGHRRLSRSASPPSRTPSLYRPVQYPPHVQRRRPPRDAPADARDPRVRGAGRRRSTATARCPGFVHLSIGQEASAVGACWPLGPTDVITSTHRGHGHCLAKGLDPLGMFAELMAKDAGTNRGRGGSMHIADPDDRHLRRQRDRRRGPADRGGRRDRGAAAPRRQRRGRVLRRRRGRARHVPRSDQPRRGLAAAGDLLLREQRLRRVLGRVGPARGAARAARRRLRRRLRRGRRQRRRRRPRPRCARSSRRRAPGAVPSSSRRRRTGGTVTTKATRERYRSPDEVEEWEARDPLLVQRARGSGRRASPTTRSTAMQSAVAQRARRRRRRGRGG